MEKTLFPAYVRVRSCSEILEKKPTYKYTNPARGMLDFCKQKFCRPVVEKMWSPGPLGDVVTNQVLTFLHS